MKLGWSLEYVLMTRGPRVLLYHAHDCLCEHKRHTLNECIGVSTWVSGMEAPLIALSSLRASLAGSADLEPVTLKGWRAQACHLCSPLKFQKYHVNPYINHATPGSLSTSNRLLQHLPLESTYLPTITKSCDIAF